jgi:hypothetical protein
LWFEAVTSYWQMTVWHSPDMHSQCAHSLPPSEQTWQICGKGPEQSAAVVQVGTHLQSVVSNDWPAGQTIGSQTGQRPVTWKSQPPPQVSEEAQASAGLWQLDPVVPFSSLHVYMSQVTGQQRSGSQVPGMSGIRFATHTRPAAQVHGFCVNPPQGPSSCETHAPASFFGLLAESDSLSDPVGVETAPEHPTTNAPNNRLA